VTDSPRQIRGRLLAPDAHARTLTLHDDAVVSFDARGRITDLRPAGPDDPAPTRPGCVWLPGFVDTHIHFPQARVLGSASGELLPWLERTVFPEESRFVDLDYAREVAREFCGAMLAQGTTCASVFSSSDPGATDALFAEMERRGLRGDVGLTLMNRGAPDVLLHDVDEAIAACEGLVARWHGADDDRLRFRVTPRFALSCTPELLAAAGDLARRHDLPIQTHISENPAEIEATAAAFPEARDYLDVYRRAGLLGRDSLFAHAVWLSSTEWDEIKDADASISHCPDSNFFLGSGAMPLREATSRGIKLGLGTDVGAGRSYSLRRCCSRAHDASALTGSETSAPELLWFATRGGAVAMGRADQIGLIAPGYDADMVAIRPPSPDADLQTLCEHLVFLEDRDGVEEVRVRGHVRWAHDASPA
jgi:guanine deaminase